MNQTYIAPFYSIEALTALATTAVLSNIHSYTSGYIRGNSGFIFLPKKDTGINPPTFWLLDNPLYSLSHSCQKVHTRGEIESVDSLK